MYVQYELHCPTDCSLEAIIGGVTAYNLKHIPAHTQPTTIVPIVVVVRNRKAAWKLANN